MSPACIVFRGGERGRGSASRRKNLVVVSRRGYYACLNVPHIRIRLPTQGDRPFNIAGIRLIYECPGYI